MAPEDFFLHLTFFLCALQSLPGGVKSEAMFLSHVPEADDDLGYIETYDPDNIHDSIVKLPGRYSPKLPYGPPVTYANDISQNSGVRPPSDRLNVRPRGQNSRGGQRGYDQSKVSPQISNSGPRLAPLRSRPGDNSRTAVNAVPSTTTESDKDHWHRRSDQRTTDRQNEDYRTADPRSTEESDVPTLDEKEELATRFDRSLPRNVTATLGDEAQLPCRVLNYNGQSVLWIRRKNLQILAAGEYRYTTDVRFSITVDADKREWRLKLKNATWQDAGVYECQVATKPMLTFAVYLNVVDQTPQLEVGVESPPMSDESEIPSSSSESKAVILEGREIFIPAHTAIRLTCAVVNHGTRPLTVRWYHGDRRLYPSHNRHLSRSTALSNTDNYSKIRIHPYQGGSNQHSSNFHGHILSPMNNPSDNAHHSSGNEDITRGPHLRHSLEHSTRPPYSPSAGRYSSEIDALDGRNPASNLRAARSPQHSEDEYSQSRDYLSDSHSTSSERYPARDGSIIINYPKLFHPSRNELDDEHHSESFQVSNGHSASTGREFSRVQFDDTMRPFQEGKIIDKLNAFEANFEDGEGFANKTFSLTVGLASAHTAGPYTCSPEFGTNATTFVRVISTAEHIQFEELQVPASAPSSGGLSCWTLLLFSQLPRVAALLAQQRYFP